jgi:hypothetical protein
MRERLTRLPATEFVTRRHKRWIHVDRAAMAISVASVDQIPAEHKRALVKLEKSGKLERGPANIG